MSSPDPVLELTLFCMAFASASALSMALAASLRERMRAVRAARSKRLIDIKP